MTRLLALTLSALLGTAVTLLYRRPRWSRLGELLAEMTYRLDTPDQEEAKNER